MKKIFVTLFLFFLMFSHNKVSFASDKIIIDYIDPELSVELIEDTSIDSPFKYPSFLEFYGINRPMVSWDLANSGYMFGVHTDNSTIYSTYYFKNHNGRLNFKLPETYGPSTKYYTFYLFEQSTKEVVTVLSIQKNYTATFAINNLNTSKNYHFGIKPNDTTVIVDGRVWR